MEKMNIHQRAIDIFNRRVNPDISQGGGGGSSDAVQYTPQELTEAQQMQARKNQGLYYEEDTFGYLLEETTLTLGEDDYIQLPFVVPIVEGKNYILVRDGVEYDVTAKLYGGSYTYVGCNPEEGPAEDDPKVSIVTGETFGATMVIEFEIGTHTYAIKGAMHVITAVDKKYVMPVIEDYMTLMKPAFELVINWDGDMSERERVLDSGRGWVKIADDFPDNATWISLTTLKYGRLEEIGSWTTTRVYYGSDIESDYNVYVLGDWSLVFVCGESFTVPGTEYTFTHGIWTYVREFSDGLGAYHEIVFPKVDAPVSRFAGAQGVGEKSFICAKGSAATTSGKGAINGGYDCEVSGDNSTAFGRYHKVLSDESFANGYSNTVKAYCSTAEGSLNIAGGKYSHVEGEWNESQFDYQHIEGQYAEKYDVENVPEFNSSKTYYPGDVIRRVIYDDIILYYCTKECTGKTPGSSDSYDYWAKGYNPLVHVVGWGNSSARKNIHTIDSIGNAMYTGDVTAKSMIIQSSTPESTKKFKITVDDTGTITATEVT